ncbi:MAG: hypothetical protein JSW61_09335 [Candidatus Thorarchaeota archaeon]|nr:MAG: hypothetical protein JSW61_09335 [Candidatus Thorarchaeota archaeon]
MVGDRQLDEDTDFFARWEEKREGYLRFLLYVVYLLIVFLLLYIFLVGFGPTL